MSRLHSNPVTAFAAAVSCINGVMQASNGAQMHTVPMMLEKAERHHYRDYASPPLKGNQRWVAEEGRKKNIHAQKRRPLILIPFHNDVQYLADRESLLPRIL